MRRTYWVSLALLAAPLVLACSASGDGTMDAAMTSGGSSDGTPGELGGGAGTFGGTNTANAGSSNEMAGSASQAGTGMELAGGANTGGSGGTPGGGSDSAGAGGSGGSNFYPGKQHWVASWGAAAVPMEPQPEDKLPPSGLTYRNVVRLSLGGDQVRITLSNLKGKEPLRIDNVTVALSNGADNIKASTLQPVTFTTNGKTAASVTIPAGVVKLSDPVNISVGLKADLVVSLHVPAQTISLYTDHPLGHGLNYYAAGDQVSAASLASATPFEPWHFLSAVDVMAAPESFAIVAFGDSITDGAGDNIRGSNARWPNYLADQLYANKYTTLAVVNEGIGSNRVLTDGAVNDRSGATPSAVHRWTYDVLQRSGVKYVIMMEGVNDIDASTTPRGPVITAADLIGAYKSLTTQAHLAGVKVIFGTLTPFGDSEHWSTKGQQIHDDVNAWIRGGAANGFDGFVDFEEATQDPAKPLSYRKEYDSGDGLHPSHQGKQAMAEKIKLTMFE